MTPPPEGRREPPALEVQGWVSGLSLTLGPILILVGLIALVGFVRAVAWPASQAPLDARVAQELPNGLLALSIPAGWFMIRRGVRGLKEQDQDAHQ